jgi:hypothetical protein
VIIYQKYAGMYFTRALNLIGSLVSIKISFDRCMFLTTFNYNPHEKRFKIYIATFVLLSFLYYVPHIMLTEIRETKGNTTKPVYYQTLNNRVNKSFAKLLMMIIQYLPFFLNIVIMTSLNVVLVF